VSGARTGLGRDLAGQARGDLGAGPPTCGNIVKGLWQMLERDEVGTGGEPDGLCGDRGEHAPHLFESVSLGRFWCSADQSQREPWRSERRRPS
jgi:hypothetical protein